MAAGIFNIAKGKIKYYAELSGGANDALIVVLLKSSGIQADATLIDHDTLSALLAASNDECDFTNYARKTLASLVPVVDDTNDRYDLDCADVVWTSAGGATNNTGAKLIVCYDPDTTVADDSVVIPLSHHDFAFTTTGADLTAQISSSGLFRAQGA